ncbi:hypothetical protein H2198_010351 [Neophaeococcomyces mojaviensis]|uniref:Uncharacterized protein n=1 Tax=Neophaeococcomyces mojaviensis TaxID=3383035 RepID=A0ACC2ZS13_9EURO|nr:hypothetical protein H2198_010351 [Knufia sp. JES_112]
MRPTYAPLSTRSSICLLQIETVNQGSILATLFTTELDSVPLYDALSYTWGCPLSPYLPSKKGKEAVAQQTIFLEYRGQSQRLYITPNLKDALIALQTINLAPLSTQRCAYLWVDAICINQSDLDEKAVQVRLMKNIYRQASKVLAWLGPEDEATSHVFEVIDNLSKFGPEKYKAVTPEDVGRPQIYVEKLGIQALNYRHWLSWVAFVHRPYFKRVWIVQENILAQDLIVVCGERVLPWTAMLSTFNFLYYSGWRINLYIGQMGINNILPPRSELGIFAKLVESRIDSGAGAHQLFHGRKGTLVAGKQWPLEN